MDTMETMPNDMRCKWTSVPNQTPVSGYFARKSLLTRVYGAALLVVASPLILLLVIIVRLTSSGPALYRQKRTGRHGVPFMMYKIRTMYHGAESITGPIWCFPNDSRITPVGKILRLLHLDELPQLINITRGDMDLIGPRPERPVFVARLTREIPNYSARLQVLPGVTGLAQINLPPDQTLHCVRKKLLLDCAYISEASFFLDMRILFCTLLRMIGVRHGRAARWLGVNRYIQLPRELRDEFVQSAPRWNGEPHKPSTTSHVNGDATAAALIATGGKAVDTFAEADLDELGDVASLSSHRPR